ncbi:hypothetical protein BLNAU_19104 [Blattamonas nauphoetae]|uniref:Uncharacterized protein n=1 Tax=Blattamonas nauphoetae TaxID=2049346 RepID=A0ABQ9X2M7_9EUKA|nr:hypothetical protein BLNAU_19104 [Blattamonas nauphoetae]
MRQAQLPECPERIIENVHRYPLLVWNEPTGSGDYEESLLEDKNMKTLKTLVASKREAGEEIKWQDLMEWFVCAVIGLESAVLECRGSFWFDWDDVVVDGFGTARIKLPASHSNSSPPHSPQSFSEGIALLSLLFLDLIDRFSLSDCLPTRLRDHFRDIVFSSVLHHIIQYLVDTGHLIPACDESEFDEIVSGFINNYMKFLADETDSFDASMITAIAIHVVTGLENEGVANPIFRLTDRVFDPRSPRHIAFMQLVEPALVEVSQLYDPELFEEAKHISSWKEFLQKVAGEEEVENDTSFLKLPFFRPTLLSLQAKFQKLTSSIDRSVASSTSSLLSSHSSPHTSLETHLDSSLRTLSSSSPFKQESLQLLTILHSLLTSPLPQSLPTLTPTDPFPPRFRLYQQDTIDPTEKFGPSLFDEPDNEILARSLVRCHTVCEVVGAEKCIRDIPAFISRLVSVLGTSDSLVRKAASSLFRSLIGASAVIHVFPRLWNQLRTAFRDGRNEEQLALLQISKYWIYVSMDQQSQLPFPATHFDWDGLISAELADNVTFIHSVYLISIIHIHSITAQIGMDKTRSIILSFENRQNAVSRIATLFETVQQMGRDLQSRLPLISYCVMISILSDREFPPALTPILTQHPDFDAHTLNFHMNTFFLLCHTSLNPHKPHQPPLDLLFERTLRMHPLDLVLFCVDPELGRLHPRLNTSLSGFHALCRRGIHLDLMDAEHVMSGNHLINLFSMFRTPLISDTFLLFRYYPPPLVVRFFLPVLSSKPNSSFPIGDLRMILLTLLLNTAPFGDCHSVRELYLFFAQPNSIAFDHSTGSIFTTHVESLEWMNIPTGFGSALAHSNRRMSFDPSKNEVGSHISLEESHTLAPLPSHMDEILPTQMNSRKHTLCLIGEMTREMTSVNIAMHVMQREGIKGCAFEMLSPVPVEVSAILEFVKRVPALVLKTWTCELCDRLINSTSLISIKTDVTVYSPEIVDPQNGQDDSSRNMQSDPYINAAEDHTHIVSSSKAEIFNHPDPPNLLHSHRPISRDKEPSQSPQNGSYGTAPPFLWDLKRTRR